MAEEEIDLEAVNAKLVEWKRRSKPAKENTMSF